MSKEINHCTDFESPCMARQTDSSHRRGVLRASTACVLLAGMGVAGNAAAQCVQQNDPFIQNAFGLADPFIGHPCAQPHPGPSTQTPLLENGVDVGVEVTTPEGQHAAVDPFANPPGSNFLFTVYDNARDLSDREMPNTLPSTTTNPYNLHDGPVLTSAIDPTSPEDDLDRIIDKLEKSAARRGFVNPEDVQFALDILEGNPLTGANARAYSGFPLLHMNGCSKETKIQPITDPNTGDVIGGHADVHMIYYGQHIESDTSFYDVTEVQEVPYTVTYHVKILNGGMDDFSPMAMNFNRYLDPVTGEDKRGPFHVSMDQTFFPMLDEGTEYAITIKQNKGKYANLTYTWGWRKHPPRVQVIENSAKRGGPGNKTLLEWECDTFGVHTDSEQAKLDAIAMIGDISPAKRMWNLFRSIKPTTAGPPGNSRRARFKRNNRRPPMSRPAFRQAVADLREAYLDWTDRTKLPTGVEADPDATITLLYANNTIYGSKQGLSGEGSGQGPAKFKGISNGSVHDWNIRPFDYKVTLLNGDHYLHAYMNVDFGGSRGWENHFQTTDPTSTVGAHPVIPPGHPAEGEPFDNPSNILAGTDANILPMNRGGAEEFLQPSPRNLADPVNGAPQLGSGCFFTFGRNHAWPNAGGPWGGIGVPPVAADGTPTKRKVLLHLNFEPSRRLRIYQFDPLHHDVAVYSLH